MSSRIRENVKHIFQCFCEVVGPQAAQPEPWIIQKFPVSYQEEEVLKSIPIFAYPCEFQVTVIQYHSFVITNVDSKYTFGFCRHDPKTETALVVLSYLPWHKVFYRLLDCIAEIIAHGQKTEELWPFLEEVYQHKVPDPGKSVEILYNKGQSKFVCLSPKLFQLPSIPENRNLTEYYNAVASDVQNMMIIFASMLFERRIIFKSSRLSRLSACVQSANDIIYPMNWQHIFIPVLPAKLKDYLLAPMPYLIGVPTIIYDSVRKSEIGDVVVLDADTNTIETPFSDLESLPSDVVTSLRRHLKNRDNVLGDTISLGFLRSLVQLIGCYREALSFQEGKRITFNGDAFVESRPQSMRPFLKQMLDLQIFQQFIEERLEMLNNGLGFSDEFEKEVSIYSEKSSSKLKNQYKDWTHTMKKEGSAFFKTVRKKANPAVKSAVKSVKERGKDVRIAYNEMRLKWRDNAPHESLSMPSSSKFEKPHSAPASPTQRRRPVTVAIPKKNVIASQSYRKPVVRPSKSTAVDRTRPYNALTPELSSPEATADLLGAPSLHLPSLDIDLLGEMKDMIFPNESLLDDSPPVDRSLMDGPDLIRLDSTPDDEFDPILARDKPSSSSSVLSHPFSLPVKPGMANPLYPYCLPTMGTTTRPSTRPPCYDQDSALLRDYGIDFKSMSLQSSANALRDSITRPPLLKPTQSSTVTANQNPCGDARQKQWTKFE